MISLLIGIQTGWTEEIKISNVAAFEIAKTEAFQLGYEPEEMDVEITFYRTPWNKYFPKDTKEPFYLEQQEKLKEKIYWAVYFSPVAPDENSILVGGDLTILIDAESGDILIELQGK